MISTQHNNGVLHNNDGPNNNGGCQNKNGQNKAIGIIHFVSVVMMVLTAGCSSEPVNRLPEIGVDILTDESEIRIEERIIRFDLENALDLKTFKSGWMAELGRIRPETSEPTLEFQFDRIRDCIVRMTVISDQRSDWTIDVSAHCNDSELPSLPAETTDSNVILQWVLPGAFQTIGSNTITLRVNPGDILKVTALEIQEGGARIGYAGVGEDIRYSVILFPDVSVSFPIMLTPDRNVLEMSLGIDDSGLVLGSDGGDLLISIQSNGIAPQEIFNRIDPVSRWTDIELMIDPRFANKQVDLIFRAESGFDQDITGDLIAVADIRLVGRDSLAPSLAEMPSVILITLDSCRVDRLGSGGDSIVRSPALDKLSRDGFTFSDCICQINNTPPSHYTILTSKRPRTHGVHDMVTPLNPIHRTLPRLLEPAGYRSAAAVSAAWLSALTHGLGPGFERFYAPRQPQRRGPETLEAARQWLESAAIETAERPFFFWLHLFDAHTPLDPPPPFDAMYYSGNPRDPDNRSMDKVTFSPEQVEYMHSWIGDITDINYLLAQYRSEITYMDRVLEDLRHLLARTGADRKTWIVVSADHGLSLDEHELYFIMAGLYEQQVHIPLIIVPPKGYKAGKVFPDTVQSLDIAPTILNITGQSIPNDFEGQTLLPLMEGRTITPINRVIAEHANNQAVMIREARYKYIRYMGEPYHREPQEGLYDLRDDLMETINLHNQKPDIEDPIAGRTDEFLSLPLGEADTGAADSDILRDKLRALGYISN